MELSPDLLAIAPPNLVAAVRTYFPEPQWAPALAVAYCECASGLSGAVQTRATWPTDCHTPVGPLDCGFGSQQATKYGPFGLVDACWDPQLNARSPFTPDEWARVTDVACNTWMASIVWSINGWRAWSTCDAAGSLLNFDVCGVPGGPIPHPRHMVGLFGTSAGLLPVGIVVGAIAGIVGLAVAGRRF